MHGWQPKQACPSNPRTEGAYLDGPLVAVRAYAEVNVDVIAGGALLVLDDDVVVARLQVPESECVPGWGWDFWGVGFDANGSRGGLRQKIHSRVWTKAGQGARLLREKPGP